MIAIVIIIMVSVIIALRLFRSKETYISLSEVIPGSRIISQEEGIIENKEVQYILGTNNLKKRKYLIESLDLQNLVEGPCIVDLRFNTQVIIKKGLRDKSGPKSVQSRRR